MTMTNNDISGGVVHDLPEDLRNTLAADAEARASWEDLTPLARNEWMRRPCCWYGCIHRTDKAVSPSVQYVLNKQAKKS